MRSPRRVSRQLLHFTWTRLRSPDHVPNPCLEIAEGLLDLDCLPASQIKAEGRSISFSQEGDYMVHVYHNRSSVGVGKFKPHLPSPRSAQACLISGQRKVFPSTLFTFIHASMGPRGKSAGCAVRRRADAETGAGATLTRRTLVPSYWTGTIP